MDLPNRAVDSVGQTIDFLLSAWRSASAAKRFFCKTLRRSHTVNPRTITVDKNSAYPSVVTRLKRAGQLWRFFAPAAMQIPEQHRGTGPSPYQTPGAAGSGLRQPANSQTNAGGVRGGGNDQEGTGSQRGPAGHEGAGNLRCRPVRGSRLTQQASATQQRSIWNLQ